MLKSALFELLGSLFTGIGQRLQEHLARSDILADCKELMRLMFQLMDQLQVYPEKLLHELNMYSLTISQFLGLQNQAGYVVNPERQTMLCSAYGHSAGAAFHGQLEQVKCGLRQGRGGRSARPRARAPLRACRTSPPSMPSPRMRQSGHGRILECGVQRGACPRMARRRC